MRRPIVALSVGCPAGVGPEIALRAAAREQGFRSLLVGDPGLVRAAARRVGIAQGRLVSVAAARGAARLRPTEIGLWEPSARLLAPVEPGRPHRAAGVAALRWIDQACDLVSAGTCAALVTGPVSKEVIAHSGAPGAARFAGHTEHLARRLAAREVIMAFHAPVLTAALCTTHLPLADVPRAITAPRVERACFWLADLLARLGHRQPRVVVAALNPHAGEGGMLGTEERRRIVPGMKRAERRLSAAGRQVALTGPLGAESAFRLAVSGQFDGVVAMYHDQATIPCKLVGFGDMVNVTLGLPIVRTSVDHGTAYDLAGTGRASPRSMGAALRLAARLVARS